MRTSASSRSLKEREMNVVVKNSFCLTLEEGGRGDEVADAVRHVNGADHLWTA